MSCCRSLTATCNHMKRTEGFAEDAAFRVLKALGTLYGGSTVGSRPDGGRDFIVDLGKLLSDANCKDGDDRAEALACLRSLHGYLISLEGPKRDPGIIHRVRIKREQESALFARIGVPSPSHQRFPQRHSPLPAAGSEPAPRALACAATSSPPAANSLKSRSAMRSPSRSQTCISPSGGAGAVPTPPARRRSHCPVIAPTCPRHRRRARCRQKEGPCATPLSPRRIHRRSTASP